MTAIINLVQNLLVFGFYSENISVNKISGWMLTVVVSNGDSGCGKRNILEIFFCFWIPKIIPEKWV